MAYENTHKYTTKKKLIIISTKDTTANLNKTAAVKNARVTEQASMKYTPLINEICYWISILHQTKHMNMYLQTETVHKTVSSRMLCTV